MENTTLTETWDQYEYFDHTHDQFLDEAWKLQTYMTFAIPIILCIVIVLSLIGNTLVVVISVFCMKLRSLTSIFILNLALSDLLFTVGLPFWVYGYIWGWTLGDAVCKLESFIFSAGFYSNMVFLVLMSIQRYMAIVHPLSRWKKGRCFTGVVICAWVVSILAALPDTVHIVAYSESGGCTFSSDTALVAIMYGHMIVFLCTFLVMAFCYIRILQTIFKSPTNRRHRMTGLAFFLVATFFICWCPFTIINFMKALPQKQIWHLSQDLKYLHAIYICTVLALIQCCLNPVIYGLFCLIFRKTVLEIFRRRATSNSG